MRVSAVCCVTAVDSAESKHRLWLFTPAHRRPRTAFGISLRAEALHPLQVARTSEEVQKTASGDATSKGTSPPLKIPQLSEGDEKI